MPGAAFHEREVTDLLGVTIEGHPSPGRLLLSENWPEGVYPLRKDVKANEVKLTSGKRYQIGRESTSRQNNYWSSASSVV